MVKISWCGTVKNKRKLKKTLESIRKQTIKPYEIIITTKGNIAQGRNEYLIKAKGDIIASFDSGCIYEKDYTEKMLRALKGNDIVMGIVKPMKPQNLIQEFCILRLPQYERFTKKDWNKFIPSNRQVMFKWKIIDMLGLLPRDLYRSDDTYWFMKARKKGLKFGYCNAVVYWEMKKTLWSYLKTIYQDTKCDYDYRIKRYKIRERISTKIYPYGIMVCILALIFKFLSLFRINWIEE